MVNVKGNKIMLLRFSNYKRYSFLREHMELISKLGHTWMKKVGKQLPEERVTELFSEPSVLLLKEPKRDGGNYYIAKVNKVINGYPQENMIYPQYYNGLINDENLLFSGSLEGTWFCITEIKELLKKALSHLRLISNDKPVEDVLSHKRTAKVYVYSDDGSLLKDRW